MRSFIPSQTPFNSPLYAQGVAFGPLAALGPVMSVAMPLLSAGMTVIGAIGQAGAQQQAGETAYRNAQLRNQQMEMQARQYEQQARQQEQQALEQTAVANREAATGQREAIERRRKGRLMASRAQAVMSAAGGGVDDSLTAGLLAEGNYAGDVAIYEGDERARVQRNASTISGYNADVSKYQAGAARYSGAGALWSGANTRDAANRSAGMTMVGGIVGAGLSLASKYGGDWFGDGVSAAPAGDDYVANDARFNSLPGGQWGVV